MKKILIISLLLLINFNSYAQELGFVTSSGGAIEIFAQDSVEWDRTAKTIAAIGKAVVLQGNLKLESARIDAFYHDQQTPEVFKVVATEKVVFTSDAAVINGETATYDLKANLIFFQGNPAKLVKDNDTILGYEKLAYFLNEKKAIAEGKATIISDGKKLIADLITAYFVDNKEKNMLELNLVETAGNVEINTANEKITADKGVYDVKKSVATLEGNVIISQKDNQLKGEKAEVNLTTGISRLTSGQAGKQRVKGRFVKESK